jgi:chromosome partitioning protein
MIMQRHIAVAASKGGTGKTTTAWNLSFGLALAGARVLVVDCDPQDNLRFIAGLASGPSTLAAAIEGGNAEPTEVRESVWLLPSGGRKLSQAVLSADGLRSITSPMKKALGNDYDFVVFDCPPEFGRLTSAALSLSDFLLVPCASTWLGLRSIEQMVEYIDNRVREARIEGDKLGIVMTFYTTRRGGPEAVRQEAKKLFRARLLKTLIRERSEIDYSQEAHKSIFEYSPKSDGAEDYSALAKEVIKRMS